MSKSFFGTVAACLAAALIGYLSAYQPPGTRKNEQETIRVRSRASQKLPPLTRADAISTIEQRTPNQLAIFKETMRRRYAGSVSAMADWTMRAEGKAQLATMSAEELGQFAQEMPRSGAGENFRGWREWQEALLVDVMRQWSLKDPAGACLGIANLSYWDRTEAFDSWLRRDPAAAQAWVTAGNFPPGSEEVGKKLQQYFLKQQIKLDFGAARESLAKQDVEEQKKTLLVWSQQMAHDPAKRDELLALIASRNDSEFTQKCYEQLVREMATKSPSEASKFLESTNLPEEQKHALSNQMLGEWAARYPHQAFAAWAALKDDEAPAELMRALDHWSTNTPGAEEAIEWVTKLDAGPARDQFKTRLIKSMSSIERYGQAADLSMTFDDPTERIRQMKIVKRKWQERFPDSYGEWYDKLPQVDRDALEKKLE